VRRYGAHLSEVIAAALRRARITRDFFRHPDFCGFGGVVAVLWQGGARSCRGISLRALSFLSSVRALCGGAVGSLASLFGAYQEAVGAARRVFDLLETVSSVRIP